MESRENRFLTDTDPEPLRILVEIARSTPVWKKFAQVSATSRTCRAFAVAGIRRRHPNANEEEVRKRLAALVLGPDLSKEVYGWDPRVEGY
jgi:hypothetical protein